MLFLLSSAMEELDGDEVRVSSRGRFAERDIVQVHCIRYIHSYLVFISIKLCRIIFYQLSRIKPKSKLNQIYLTFLPAKHSSDVNKCIDVYEKNTLCMFDLSRVNAFLISLLSHSPVLKSYCIYHDIHL